jgi:hypothetical protein
MLLWLRRHGILTAVRASTIRVSQQAIALAMSSKSYVEEKEVRRERRAGSWHIARL